MEKVISTSLLKSNKGIDILYKRFPREPFIVCVDSTIFMLIAANTVVLLYYTILVDELQVFPILFYS